MTSRELSGRAAVRFIENAPDAILAVRFDGTVVMANRQAEILFGRSGEQLVGCSVDTLVPDAARANHAAYRAEYASAPRIRQMGDPGARVSAMCSDGRLIPVEIALSPVEVDYEQLVIAVIRDVRDRLQLETEFEGIRQSLDAVDDAVFMFDPDSLAFSYANLGAINHTGYTRRELTGGMTPLDIKPEFDDASFRALLEPLHDGSRSTTFTTVHRHKDGHDIPVEISLSCPATTHAVPRRFVALVRDITERQAAEARLLASEEAFRSAFDDAAVPMALVDLDDHASRKILRANRALASMLGYELDSLIGTSMTDLTHPDDAVADDAGAAAMADGRVTYSTEKRYRHADGTYRWGALDASLLRGSSGRRQSLAHIVDITRRIEAEDARDRREMLLAALAAIRKAALDDASADVGLQVVVEAVQNCIGDCRCLIGTLDPEGRLLWQAMDASLGPRDLDAIEAVVPGVPDDDFSIIQAKPAKNARFGDCLVAPLRTANANEGIMVVARDPGAMPFTEADGESARALAADAALMLVLQRARSDQRRMLLAQDRERIAHDLHDLVIQRIFAAGMRLQAASNSPAINERASEIVGELDDTIAVIRRTIFELTQPDASVASEIERLIDRHRAVGRNHVNLEIEGDLETLPVEIRDHLPPTINELLSNVTRHANATNAVVLIAVTNADVVVQVTDDGVGIDLDHSKGFGLHNLAKRATSLGGSLTFAPGPDRSGTEVNWTVPIGE